MSVKIPHFRRGIDGQLLMTNTSAATQHITEKWSPALPPSDVEKNALEAVRCRDGDITDNRDVLGEFIIQVGRYKGKSFCWLLENCPGYVGWLIGDIIEERLTSSVRSSAAQLANKNALLEYASLFEESTFIVRAKLQSKSSALAQKWDEMTSKRVLPTSRFALLLSKRHLSPEAVAKKVQQMSTPSKKIAPNLSRARRSPATAEDLDLMEAMELFEKQSGAAQTITSQQEPMKSSTSTSSPLVEIQRTDVLQDTGSDLRSSSTPPRERVRRKVFGDTSSTSTSSPLVEIQSTSMLQDTGSNLSASSTPPRASSPLVAMKMTSVLQDTDSTGAGILFGWKQTLPSIDHHWVSEKFFRLGKRGTEFDFSRVTKLWYEPPQPSLSRNVLNKVDRYFAHQIFLWMPRHLFNIVLLCTNEGCNGRLVNAGVHQKTRLVLDIDCKYNMAAESLHCPICKKKIISWSQGILNQLDNSTRSKFPCILTTRYACDLKVVRQLRLRSLGNSSSAIRKQILEQHGEKHLTKLQLYLTNCKMFKDSSAKSLITPPSFQREPVLHPIPNHRWFMKIYQIDVIQRIDYIKATITSVFGTVLKMDSTKKITNKLAGRGRKTAMWATNIGNEFGQVLMSVLTEGEGLALKPMIDGLVARYINAGVPPPTVLYVDRDCCESASVKKYFTAWPSLRIRLDIWHFMRRFANGCSTDKHPLYSVFMAKLSHCIFKWDEKDVQYLKLAKRSELMSQGILNPSDSDVMKKISSAELALHCKRVTRGTMETTRCISNLIQSLDGPKGCDTLGVALFDSERINAIWIQQRKHVSCIQDPADVQLYTRLSSQMKGDITVPVYRCARGSTSLESFHLHMNRFIPGTLAKDINFQVFLLDGLFRWNSDREASIIGTTDSTPHTYSGPMKKSVNKLYEDVWGEKLFPDYQAPGKYTGELIGIEYLYSQTGKGSADYYQAAEDFKSEADAIIHDTDDQPMEDEGFIEQIDVPDPTISSLQGSEDIAVEDTPRPVQLVRILSTDDYKEMMEETDFAQPSTSSSAVDSRKETESESKKLETSVDDDIVGPDNVPGYAHVLRLADFLVSLRNTPAMSPAQVKQMKSLWQMLSTYDKRRTVFAPRFSKKPLVGRFKSPRKTVAPGVESIDRVILGPNQGPAQWPNCNRYTEATIQKLLQVFLSDQRRQGKTISRFHLVLGSYHNIREVILKSQDAMEDTDIQLPLLNKKTLQQWFNEKSKHMDKKVLQQGLDLPSPCMTATQTPAALGRPASMPLGTAAPFTFHDPPSTVGMAKVKERKVKPNLANILPRPAESPATFQLVTLGSGSTAVLVPSAVASNTADPQTKRKEDEEDGGREKRKYIRTSTVRKCTKCGKERTPPGHQQYMGYRYCPETETISFTVWRERLQRAGAARKKKP